MPGSHPPWSTSVSPRSEFETKWMHEDTENGSNGLSSPRSNPTTSGASAPRDT